MALMHFKWQTPFYREREISQRDFGGCKIMRIDFVQIGSPIEQKPNEIAMAQY